MTDGRSLTAARRWVGAPDAGSADTGQRAIEWMQRRPIVAELEPTFAALARAHSEAGAPHLLIVADVDLATAVTATALRAAGVGLTVVAPDQFAPDSDVTAALVDLGVGVIHAARDQGVTDLATVLPALASEPVVIVDRQAVATSTSLSRARPNIRGVSEVSTTGIAAIGSLVDFEAPLVDGCASTSIATLNARGGLAQAAVQAIARLTNLRIFGKRFVVVGYNSLAATFATAANAMGGVIDIADVDDAAADRARRDTFRVDDLSSALERADVVVSVATDVWQLIGRHGDDLPAGALVARLGYEGAPFTYPPDPPTPSTHLRVDVTTVVAEHGPLFVLADGAPVHRGAAPFEPALRALVARIAGAYEAVSHPVGSTHPLSAAVDERLTAAGRHDQGVTCP